MSASEEIRETVRRRYAAAANRSAAGDHEGALVVETSCCGPAPVAPADAQTAEVQASCCGPAPVATTDEQGRVVFGAELYGAGAQGAPDDAVAASLGCGVPTAVALLHPGEVVLDLGSGAGADVLISARRVAPGGRAIGLDMTDEMLDLARRNAAEAGVDNVEFLKGYLEDIPLPDDSVDVVISNCVINLAADKNVVLAEAARVLRPGGRLAFSDVLADEDMDEATRADMSQWTGCIAGALTQTEFALALASAGFTDVEIRPTHRVHTHAQAAIIRASAGPVEARETSMTLLEVFEPALCCATGVCGEDVDQELVTFLRRPGLRPQSRWQRTPLQPGQRASCLRRERGREGVPSGGRVQGAAVDPGRRCHRHDRGLPRPGRAVRLGRCGRARRGRIGPGTGGGNDARPDCGGTQLRRLLLRPRRRDLRRLLLQLSC